MHRPSGADSREKPVFGLAPARGVGVRSIAKRLNEEHAHCHARSSSARRRGNRRRFVQSSIATSTGARSCGTPTRKRDSWGRKKPQARTAEDWIHLSSPVLRIVSDDLWRTAHRQSAAPSSTEDHFSKVMVT